MNESLANDERKFVKMKADRILPEELNNESDRSGKSFGSVRDSQGSSFRDINKNGKADEADDNGGVRRDSEDERKDHIIEAKPFQRVNENNN